MLFECVAIDQAETSVIVLNRHEQPIFSESFSPGQVAVGESTGAFAPSQKRSSRQRLFQDRPENRATYIFAPMLLLSKAPDSL
jgi:hypothetical protein